MDTSATETDLRYRHLTPRLRTMLRLTRSESPRSTWKDVATALQEEYGTGLTLYDVIHHTVAALAEAFAEPQFGLIASPELTADLLLAPAIGFHAIDTFGARSLSTAYSLEQYFNAHIAFMVGQLSVAQTGWCRDWLAEPDWAIHPRNQKARHD